jgi:hypothetical protein
MQDREAGALEPVHNVKPYKQVQGIHQIDPQTKHPATKEWKRAFQIFDLLL